jgi:hypothetical protein
VFDNQPLRLLRSGLAACGVGRGGLRVERDGERIARLQFAVVA